MVLSHKIFHLLSIHIYLPLKNILNICCIFWYYISYKMPFLEVLLYSLAPILDFLLILFRHKIFLQIAILLFFFFFQNLFGLLFVLLHIILLFRGIPYFFSDGLTAKQMVFDVLLLSATTRFVVLGSKPLSLHSTDA